MICWPSLRLLRVDSRIEQRSGARIVDMQTKNIIKLITLAVLALFFGEGVFGLGLYWPFLLLLIDWKGIYWLAFGFGILLSLVVGIEVGFSSLFLVLVLGVISFFVGVKRSSQWLLILLGVVLNLIFDKLFGLSWNFGEMLLVLGVGFWVVRGLDKQETIRINY